MAGLTTLLNTQANVAPSSAGGNQRHVDILGVAAMRVASRSSNAFNANAITPVIADLTNSQLRRGQVARLSPWTNLD